MRNTEETVRRKWEKKIDDIKAKAEFKYSVILANRKRKVELGWEHEVEKWERKRDSYIKKKETEYKRKMANEIRKLQGRPERVIKEKKKKLNLEQFAAEILQENSRLRDSDKDGYGHCISCDAKCSWENHQGGHRESRRFKNLILEEKNVNLQCRSCNYATGPQGDTLKKAVVNHHYDINLDKKYGEGTAQWIQDKKIAYLSSKDSGDWDFKELIPRLIEENKKLWATKSFYKPSKNWEKVWNNYPELH